MVVVLALVTTGLVVTRPAAPALDELGTVGAGAAGGRDAARTGRTGEPAFAEDPREVWRERADLLTQPVNGWAQLARDVVLLHRDNGNVTVLDRGTGEPLWSTQQLDWVGVIGGVGVRQGAGTLVALDLRTGETLWDLDGVSTRGGLLGWTDDRLLVHMERAEAADPPVLRWVDARSGATIFERTFERLAETDFRTAWIETANDRWIMLSHGWSNDGRHQGYSFLSIHDGSVSPVRPAPLPDGRGDDPGVPVVSVLLDGDRALLGADGRLDEVDLATGDVVADRSDLLPGEADPDRGFWMESGGDLLAIHDARGTTQVLDRSTLEPMWTLAGGWLDLWRLRQDPSQDRVVASVDGRPAIVDVESGRVIVSLDEEPQWMDVDAAGATTLEGTTFVYRSHDGGVSWSYTDRVPDGALVLGQDAAYLGTDQGLAVHDIHGGWELSTRNEQVMPFLAGDGEHVIDVNGPVVKSLEAGETRVRWAQRASGPVLGLAVGASGVFASSPEVLQRFDVETGELEAQRGVRDVRHLSVAGDDAGAALVLLAGSSCGDIGCEVVAQRHDATTLDEVWASEPIAGACAGATLAGHHVAVPTVTGMTFLDADTGALAHTWEVEGAACLDAAWTDGDYVLATASALVVGAPGGEPRRVALDHEPTGAPIILGRQAVMRTAEGIRGADLDDPGRSWFVPLDIEPIAGPVAVDKGLVVALADRTVVRLG